MGEVLRNQDQVGRGLEKRPMVHLFAPIHLFDESLSAHWIHESSELVDERRPQLFVPLGPGHYAALIAAGEVHAKRCRVFAGVDAGLRPVTSERRTNPWVRARS